jgi:hypothetical protein|tara:strand:- start:606 stop:884 length:279 start_codon:yes stop_codon:yes gene_type:complete
MSSIQRIGFRVKDTAGNTNILSILQGGAAYGRGGKSVELAYYTIDSDDEMTIMSFVSLRQLRNVITDIISGDTPEEVQMKYDTDFERETPSR